LGGINAALTLCGRPDHMKSLVSFDQDEARIVETADYPRENVRSAFVLEDDERRPFCSIEGAIAEDRPVLILRYIWQRAKRVHKIDHRTVEEIIDFLHEVCGSPTSSSSGNDRERLGVAIRVVRGFFPLFGFAIQRTMTIWDDFGNEVGRIHFVFDEYKKLEARIAFAYLMDESTNTHFLAVDLQDKFLRYLEQEAS
jgi:hypothetical protein